MDNRARSYHAIAVVLSFTYSAMFEGSELKGKLIRLSSRYSAMLSTIIATDSVVIGEKLTSVLSL